MQLAKNTITPLLLKIIHHKAELILLALLVISLLLRLNQYNSARFGDESSRDYLVARHISHYHETPLVGPIDMGDGFFRNSPFYYYFLSGFLFLNDSLFFLDSVNIFLQLANIAIIYLLAKRVFGNYPALIAATIFAVGDYFLIQSENLWQPYIMQPFINLSYLLLVVSYQTKRPPFLTASVGVFLIAVSIHRSALAQVPLMVILSLTILKLWKAKLSTYLYLLFSVFFVGVVLYTPVLFSNAPPYYPLQGPNFNLGNYSNNLIKIVFHFGETLFTGLKIVAIQNPYIYLVLTLLPLSYLISARKGPKNFFILLTIISTIVQFSLATVFHLNDIRYFTPILGLFIISLSATIAQIGQGNLIRKLLSCILVLAIIYVFSPDLTNKLTHESGVQKRTHLSGIQTLKNQMTNFKQVNGLSDYKFFRISVYRKNDLWTLMDSVYYAALEKEFNQKFVTAKENRLSDSVYFGKGYSETNIDNYRIIICYEFQNTDEINTQCLNRFLAENPRFSLGKLISKDKFQIVIYTAEKSVL